MELTHQFLPYLLEYYLRVMSCTAVIKFYHHQPSLTECIIYQLLSNFGKSIEVAPLALPDHTFECRLLAHDGFVLEFVTS